ncbi:MAG: CoA synthetase [Rhodospirillaceae bacterium]|nr:CoA synthetase [Rhodospirillaceae bacterium]
MTRTTLFQDLDALLEPIGDGASIVVPTETNGVAMAATRALIRKGVKDLTLVGGPTSGLQVDLLIGAGVVSTIECAAVSLGEFGIGPRFRAAAEAGRLTIRETTCPAVHAALQAGEKGNPFMPLRGIVGSDLLERRPDWRVIDNPFASEGTHDPIVLLPAITPDFALFHAALADVHGNVWVGRRREIMTMAHAAGRALVTVEGIYDGDLLADETMAPGTLPALYVEGLSVQEKGSWPLGFADAYPTDAPHMRAYVAAAKSEEGFARYLDEFVLNRAAAA